MPGRASDAARASYLEGLGFSLEGLGFSPLPAAMLIAVTDHAADRFRQRVRGTLEPKAEIMTRVGRAYAAGRVEPGDRGAVLVTDLERAELVYVCRPEDDQLVVTTLWERGPGAAVPKRFTDALRRDDKLS